MKQKRKKNVLVKGKKAIFMTAVALMLSGCAGKQVVSVEQTGVGEQVGDIEPLEGIASEYAGTQNDMQDADSKNETQDNMQDADSKNETDVKNESNETTEELQQEDNESDTNKQVAEKELGKIAPDPIPSDGQSWGLSYGDAGTQPRGNAPVDVLAQYDAYYMGDDEEKVIYLTFDCGYENGNTEPILEALKKHNVTGTFFVTGYFLETQPELVNKMVEEGHAVGSHTYNHPNITTLPDKQAFQEEMDAVRDKFMEVTGRDLDMYYRPPEGRCSADNLLMAKEMGYSTIFWSLAHVDWDAENQPSRKSAIEKLTTRIHPGAVVLLHNTSQTNGEILDELITKWEEMGYTIRPLSELTGE